MRSMTFRVRCVAALVALTGLAACGDDSGVSTRDNTDDTTDTTEVVDTGPDTGAAEATIDAAHASVAARRVESRCSGGAGCGVFIPRHLKGRRKAARMKMRRGCGYLR